MYQTPLRTPKALALASWGVREHRPSLPARRGPPADAGGSTDRALGGGGRGGHGSRTEALERLHEAWGGGCFGEGHSCYVGQVRRGGC